MDEITNKFTHKVKKENVKNLCQHFSAYLFALAIGAQKYGGLRKDVLQHTFFLSAEFDNLTQIKEVLTPLTTDWTDVTISFSSGRGPGGSSGAVDITLVSNDTNAVEQVIEEITQLLETNMPMLSDISNDLENGSPRYRMAIDIDAAAAAGVSVSSIANEIRTAVSGTTATTYYDGGTEIEVIG